MQDKETDVKIDFEQRFESERSEWTEKVRSLAIRMKNIREVVEVQVDLYSNRQILLEYIAKLGQVLVKLNSKLRKDKSARLRYYSEQHQVKYGASEKNPLIDGDLAGLKERIDVIESQVTFLNETVKTTDHMLYGIKHRIMLEEYLRNGSVKER